MESTNNEVSNPVVVEVIAEAAPAVIIKKRSSRPQQRRRDDSDDEQQDTTDGIDREKLKDLKLLHQTRQRQTGVSTQELISGEKKSGRSSHGGDDLKSILGNQFNSRMDYGFQQEVPHQKLMDEFIDQKLGLKKDTTEAKVVRPDDELYKVPEDLKFDNKEAKVAGKVKMGGEEEGAASSWSTGIAEVALPMSFKLKNIEDTEKLTKKAQAYQGLLQHHQSGTAYQRFQIDRNISTGLLPRDAPLEHALPTTDINGNQKRPLKSTDDLVASRFKKRMYDKR